MSERKAYSRALLSCSQQRRMVIAYPLAFGEVGVKERVRSVLRYKRPAFWAAGAAIAASLPPIDQDGPETDSYVLSETKIANLPETGAGTGFGTDANNPAGDTASPKVSTGYPGYDALIAEAQDALENFDPLTDERGDHFSGVIYINWDFETLGYILRDLDGNGVEELIFGENGEDGCIANESDGSTFEFSYAYYAYSGAELVLIEAVIYNNESYAGDRDQRFYSTEYAGQLYEYEYEYGEKPAPKVYYEITSEKAEEIIAGYVYEHPRFTPFVEP